MRVTLCIGQTHLSKFTNMHYHNVASIFHNKSAACFYVTATVRRSNIVFGLLVVLPKTQYFINH